MQCNAIRSSGVLDAYGVAQSRTFLDSARLSIVRSNLPERVDGIYPLVAGGVRAYGSEGGGPRSASLDGRRSRDIRRESASESESTVPVH